MINEIKNILSILVNFQFKSDNLMQRGVADYIETLCKNEILKLDNGNDIIVNEAKSVRSIEDVEIHYDNKLYKIDIKTHDVNRVFSMPNLISISRAKNFLSDFNNHIIYVFIDYMVENNFSKILDIKVQNIESLDWSYLAIQNLGKGQLQIKNMSNELFFNNDMSREKWIKILKEEAKKYYDKLILKVTEYKNSWEDIDEYLDS